MKYSINRAVQAAARLAMIKKGKSLNDRDASTRLKFYDDQLEVVCGGLFAIARLELSLDCTVPTVRYECSNEMLDSIAQTWACESMRVESIKNGISIVTNSGCLTLPSKTLWDTFVYTKDTDVDFCYLEKEAMLSVFAALPNLLQDDNEKKHFSAMRMRADGQRLTSESTDNRMFVNLSVPCRGKLPEIAMPFAAVSLLRWALTEFGSTEPLALGLRGNTIIAKVGPFSANIKQSATKFPNLSEVMSAIKKRNVNTAKFATDEIVRASKQAKSLKYGHCDIKLGARSFISSGDDRESVSVEVACERNDDSNVTVSLSADYLHSASSGIQRLGFEKMDYKYVDKVRPVLFTAVNDQFSAEVVIAPMED